MDPHGREGSASVSPQRAQPHKANDTTSSVSEKIARMGLRECTAYETQLRSLLDAAVAEPPPHGVSTAEVEHRMRLIQLALEEVTARIERLRRAKEERERQRYMGTQLRRAQTEEEAAKARVFEDKHRGELVEEIRLAQVAYFKEKNTRDDEKAAHCREHNDRAQRDTMLQATANEGRRERNLEALLRERERRRQELCEKDRAQQESIKETNRRKAAREEMRRREREKAGQLHEQAVEAKLAAIRESKRSKWVAKVNASRAKSNVVFKNGKAILETDTKDHDKLVADLQSKVKSQETRYAEERAEQLHYLQQRRQHRAIREDRQQANLLRLIKSRLERGDAIVEEARQKRERGELTKEAQATQYLEHGIELRKDIAAHRRRADEIQRQRDEEALTKNYRRWNHRAARIIAELNEAVREDEAAAEHASASAAGGSGIASNRNRDEQRPASTASSQRFVRLPSPSDFAV